LKNRISVFVRNFGRSGNCIGRDARSLNELNELKDFSYFSNCRKRKTTDRPPFREPFYETSVCSFLLEIVDHFRRLLRRRHRQMLQIRRRRIRLQNVFDVDPEKQRVDDFRFRF
jgi:hypothetical protein